jgi:hypothetical protein
MTLEGGCFCGAVRYRVDGEPGRVTHCHCRHCRRLSGAAFVTWAELRPEELAFTTGEPRTVESREGVTRTFCDRCGTPLTFRDAEDDPPVIDVVVCSLDEPERVQPEDHVWSGRRLPWIRLDDRLPCYPRRRVDGPAEGDAP